jgi:hypothetical protein
MEMQSKCVFVVMTLVMSTVLAMPAAAAPNAMTTGEIQQQFLECGYQVGNRGGPTNGNYVVVRDPGTDDGSYADARILMAIVYSSAPAALGEHQRVHRQAEERLGSQWPFSDDHGPQLLPGYGASVWRANVALVQTSRRTLNSMYTYDIQTDETRIARPELFELGFVSDLRQYGVDRDFVTCLENAAPLASESGPKIVEPMFMPGRPW